MTVGECACPKSPPREKSSPLQGEATPFSPSAGCGLLSQSIHVLPRMDHYRKLQRPHLARWRRTLCPPLHESTSLAALLRHFRSVPGRVAAAVTPYPPFRCRCTPDKESRAFAPRYFILSPCTPKGGLQAARQILSRSVLHSASTSHPLRSCSVSAPFPTHLPRARSPARLFLSLRCSFLTSSLQSQTRKVVSLSGCLCPDSLLGPLALSSSRLGRESKLALLSLRSVGSGLRSVPSWTQTLSAFRSYLPAAYRVCFAPQSSAESSEPSGRQLLRR